MKSAIYFLMIVLCGCAGRDLSKEEAANLIRQQYGYPKQLTKPVSRVESDDAVKLLNNNFEKDGWVSVVKRQRLIDMGKPIVFFQDKARPYLVDMAAKDTNYLRIVKMAVVDLDKVTGIKIDGKIAKVEYTFTFREQTPFIKLLDDSLDSNKKHYACFELYDTGWKLVKCLF